MNALIDPALACELTLRERTALMGPADWEDQVDRLLSWPVDAVTPSQVQEAAQKSAVSRCAVTQGGHLDPCECTPLDIDLDDAPVIGGPDKGEGDG